ncbi:MAG TPA: ATP-binding protein [Gaiellaceae bacterium]|nr:ATP-binding protein [Gaiellaceae bacterium]
MEPIQASAAPVDDVDATLEMSVDNITFMLERLGRDCDDVQFVRELTQNAIEAGASHIVWDYDRNILNLTSVYKLCCIDNGHGMTGDEMIQFINNLSSSTRNQSIEGNFGVGAKVAAATRNPQGLIYQSWKNGQGAMVQLWRDPVSNKYGMRHFQRPDGSWGYWQPIGDNGKPEEIRNHGTKVILLGTSEEHNTMEPPVPVPTESRWISRYLNGRYFRFPEGVEVKAREGWDADPSEKRNLKRTVRGEGEFLDRFSDHSGVVDLSECRIHWWILNDDDKRRNASELVNTGHFATLYQDELYEMRVQRSGVARLQQFGVIFGYERVVLYLEPSNGSTARITSNTARSQLLRNGEPLPYADWAAEFRERMPQEIRDHIDAVIAGASGVDHHEAIAERLKHYNKLFRLSRYRLRPEGPRTVEDPVIERPKPGRPGRGEDSGAAGTPRKKQDTTGRLLAAMLADQGLPAEDVEPPQQDLPRVKWVTIENGLRTPGFLDDRAAQYVGADNLIQANGDFRVYTDMADYFCGQYGVESGNAVVTEVVREWFEQALVETVIGCQALQGEKEWSPRDVEAALSEEALTAAVMQRYHVANAVKRSLGSKLGSIRDKSSDNVAA